MKLSMAAAGGPVWFGAVGDRGPVLQGAGVTCFLLIQEQLVNIVTTKTI